IGVVARGIVDDEDFVDAIVDVPRDAFDRADEMPDGVVGYDEDPDPGGAGHGRMIAGSPEREEATQLARTRRLASEAGRAAGCVAAPTAAGSENRHLDLVRSICARRTFRLSRTFANRNDAYAVDVTTGRASRALLGDLTGASTGRFGFFLASPGLAVAAA